MLVMLVILKRSADRGASDTRDTHLEVRHSLAELEAEEPGLGDVPEDRGRQADEQNQQVGHRQVDDEVIGDGPHGVIAINGHADERVADQADHEDEAVHSDQHPVGEFGEYVLHHQSNIVLVRDAIVVGAVGGIGVIKVVVVRIVISGVFEFARVAWTRRGKPNDDDERHRHHGGIHAFIHASAASWTRVYIYIQLADLSVAGATCRSRNDSAKLKRLPYRVRYGFADLPSLRIHGLCTKLAWLGLS